MSFVSTLYFFGTNDLYEYKWLKSIEESKGVVYSPVHGIFPFVLDYHQYYELMVAQGEGRCPMTSSDAETDSKPIIIIIIVA